MLADETWSGRTDFLPKVNKPSGLGNWSYEVVETQLARDTKAGTILQLCVYSYLLRKIQGVRPESMYVVTRGNDFAQLPYRIDECGAYFRLVDRGNGEFFTEPGETYPALESQRDFCAGWSKCEQRRQHDDHLCYVAGITKSQIKRLRSIGVDRLGALAQTEDIPDPPHGSTEAPTRVCGS